MSRVVWDLPGCCRSKTLRVNSRENSRVFAYKTASCIDCTGETLYTQVTHKEPEEAVDHLAFRGVRALRWTFDVLAGFKTGVIDEHKCEGDTGLLACYVLMS